MCWLIVVGFPNQNAFKKATKQLFYHSLKIEKGDVAILGLKSQISKTKDDAT